MPTSRLAELETLISNLSRGDLLEAEAAYVELFDRGRATSLHLFEHVHGDSRDRGPAMIDLSQTYAQSGLFLSPDELPDQSPFDAEPPFRPRRNPLKLYTYAAVVFAVCYGISNGILTITRGVLPMHVFGPRGYATLMGRMALSLGVLAVMHSVGRFGAEPSFPIFFASFMWLFFWTGVGNASTFQMIPAIVRADMPRLLPNTAPPMRLKAAEMESAAIVGFQLHFNTLAKAALTGKFERTA